MGESIRVLHVGTGPDSTDLARERLEAVNDRLEVETAASPAEGLDRLAEMAFDCVVCEVDPSDGDGADLLEAVRAQTPEPPFILFADDAAADLPGEAALKGRVEYLRKGETEPYLLLATRVEDVVEWSRLAGRTFEGLVESLPAAVYRADPATLETTYVNPAIRSLTGYSPEEWVGNPDLKEEAIHPADREYVIESLREAQADAADDALEYRVVREDGEVRWVADRFSWQRDGSGTAQSLVGVMTDVTEPLERDRELETLTDDLEQLHLASNRLHAADSAEQCYEIAIDAAVNILGMDWCSLVAPAEDEDVFEIKAISEHGYAQVGFRPFGTDEGIAGRVFQTGESHILDDIADAEEAKPTDDSIRSALTVPVGDWGVFHAMSSDPNAFNELDRSRAELFCTSLATALERLERRHELEAQNERLEQFSSIVSHDLRNPLTVAQGRLELARSEIDSEHLDSVADAQQRMNRLIDDLLTFARVGQAALDIEPVDLGGLAEVCWLEVDSGAATLESRDDLDVMADRERLRQLLGNLLENAVEHGGEAVTVTVGPLDDGFFVEDDGTGIPEEKIEQTFEPGYSTSPGGAGFGLSIVSEIAEAHDWQVTVAESAAGGARFEFTRVELPE